MGAEDLEASSCFDLSPWSPSRLQEVKALRNGFIHVPLSSPASVRRSRSAEPRSSAESEDLAFERFVATFHFQAPSTPLKQGASRELDHELDPPEDTTADVSPAFASEDEWPLEPAVECDSPSRMRTDAPEFIPGGGVSPLNMRADAPTFVPGGVSFGSPTPAPAPAPLPPSPRIAPAPGPPASPTRGVCPLSTMPPNSPGGSFEAGARVPPPPPRAPPSLSVETPGNVPAPPTRAAGDVARAKPRVPPPPLLAEPGAKPQAPGPVRTNAEPWRPSMPRSQEASKLTKALLRKGSVEGEDEHASLASSDGSSTTAPSSFVDEAKGKRAPLLPPRSDRSFAPTAGPRNYQSRTQGRPYDFAGDFESPKSGRFRGRGPTSPVSPASPGLVLSERQDDYGRRQQRMKVPNGPRRKGGMQQQPPPPPPAHPQEQFWR